MMRSLLSATIVCSMFFLGVGQAAAQSVGAGTGITLEVVDTPDGGPRINVDESFSATLDANIYRAVNFSFAAGQDGDAIPFLATLTGVNADEYEIIALGDKVDISGAPITETVPFGGSDMFTLTESTTVFGGFTNSPDSPHNPIFLDNNTAETTDHDNEIEAPIMSVGQIIGGPDAAMSHANLGRTYAFAIDLEVVPEPGVFSLLGVGLGMLVLVARRKRQRSV